MRDRNLPNDAPAANAPEPGTTQSADATDAAETVIGRYHLVRRIGEGGMGEVWLAEQKEPVRRRVALKLIKGSVYTKETLARFDSERQALALMDHPAIAKVFDAGSTPQGAPYFVMEYVAGVPITDYCDDNKLSIHQRLELFRHVCDGVQHAHLKAIIHRDLKPSNILVTEVDGRPAPKIIDFGVAKALAQKLTAETMFTHAGVLVGTPQYMSPEQARSSGEDIDTRTDVYSLGIIFYELLAGEPPIELRKVAFEEFLRRLREDEPPKPSTRVRTQDQAKSSQIARRRQTVPIALANEMHGELDSIALKALEKDRSRRYSSPADLAADIRRYLNKEAVLAVPPSVLYRARKFARRHRAALVTACAFVIVLMGASIISIRQSVRANREAAVAQAVNDFLQNDLLAQASAASQSERTKLDPDLKVRTALDRAAARIGGKFDRQPEVEAAIRDTMGQTYQNLGVYPEAKKQFERALELRRRVLGAENPETLKTMGRLGMTDFYQSNYPEAAAILSQTFETERRVFGPEHPETVRVMTNLGGVYRRQGKYTQAEPLVSQALEIKRRTIGPEDPSTLISMSVLAEIYEEQAKYPQAEALINQALEIQRRVLGPEHPSTLVLVNNLANVYNAQGKYEQAEALHRQNWEVRRRVLGPEHPYTISSMSNLADIYNAEGKFQEAESLGSQAIEIRRRVLGPEHSFTLYPMNNLADTYMKEGKYAQAEALCQQTLEIRRRVMGAEHYETVRSMFTLGEIFSAEHKYSEAETLFQQILEMERRILGPQHPDTLETFSHFASLYQQQGKYALAETYAAQALEGRRHVLGQEHRDTIASENDLALAYLAQGKFTDSEPLARQAMETERKNWPDDWQGFRAESLLGASLAGEKKYAEAEPLLLDGYKGMVARKSRIAVPDGDQLDHAGEWIAQLYQAWGKREKAAEWRKKSGPTKATPLKRNTSLPTTFPNLPRAQKILSS